MSRIHDMSGDRMPSPPQRTLSDCTSAEIMCLVRVAEKRVATLEEERIELLRLYEKAMMREILAKNEEREKCQ